MPDNIVSLNDALKIQALERVNVAILEQQAAVNGFAEQFIAMCKSMQNLHESYQGVCNALGGLLEVRQREQAIEKLTGDDE